MSFERNIVINFLRKHNPIGRPRHYNRLDTAIPRATQHLMLEGRPGDVAEISHVNGRQLGTIKIRAGGRIETQYEWEN